MTAAASDLTKSMDVNKTQFKCRPTSKHPHGASNKNLEWTNHF